jgi:hypothetical protein
VDEGGYWIESRWWKKVKREEGEEGRVSWRGRGFK